MNFSLSSIVDLEKDKRYRQRVFIQNQSQMNGQIKNTHKNNNYYVQAQEVIGLSTTNIPSPHKVKFKEQNFDCRIQGRILEQQLKLQKLQTEYDHQKSRIEDQNNAKTYRIKYPYGKQNVKISQDVLQKYSTNTYLNQSQILKRFQNQAKKIKQQKSLLKSCKRICIQSNNDENNLITSLTKKRQKKKKPSLLQSELLRFENKKQKYLSKNIQSDRISIQNPQISKIQNLVNDIKLKLKLSNSNSNNNNNNNSNVNSNRNSSRIATDRSNPSNRQDQYINSLQKSRIRLKKLNFFQMQQKMIRNQIPLIVYTKDYRRKNHMLQTINNDISQINITKEIQKPQQYNQVLKILNLNKKRLDVLTHHV